MTIPEPPEPQLPEDPDLPDIRRPASEDEPRSRVFTLFLGPSTPSRYSGALTRGW
ncbi:MAG TPA: hypothetical protein VIJ34_01135 [Acidimicrobiales bacterium]